MMNPEQINHLIAIISGVIGMMMLFIGGGMYFFFREGWQITIAFVGIFVLLFAGFADN